jgi:pimeloyl-ACP methyl ester carboxylesterase
MLRPLLVVLVVLTMLTAALWLGQRRLIYFPDRTPPGPPVPAGLARPATLHTVDGLRLGAWLLPAHGEDRQLAVLVAPGNGGNRRGRAPLAAALAAAGFTVLLLDYRGYGANPGRPSETGLARDARAALDYLTGAGGFPRDRVIYFGESLGAAVVAELATRYRPAGLVLRSPFVDLAAVGRMHYPWLPVRLLLRDRYPLAEHVSTVAVPTTVIYGSADSVVPPSQSRAVAERAAGDVRVVVVPGADHNDEDLVDGPRVVDAVVELAERVGGPAPR